MTPDQIMQEAADFKTRTNVSPTVVFLHPEQILSVYKDQFNYNQVIEELEAERLELGGMEVRVLGVYGPCFAGTEKPLQSDSKEVSLNS